MTWILINGRHKKQLVNGKMLLLMALPNPVILLYRLLIAALQIPGSIIRTSK